VGSGEVIAAPAGRVISLAGRNTVSKNGVITIGRRDLYERV